MEEEEAEEDDVDYDGGDDDRMMSPSRPRDQMPAFVSYW